ncbi:MAG: hypothetical protein GY772_31110 [bacterium]|nr:hypothetical protein [bacterium]
MPVLLLGALLRMRAVCQRPGASARRSHPALLRVAVLLRAALFECEEPCSGHPAPLRVGLVLRAARLPRALRPRAPGGARRRGLRRTLHANKNGTPGDRS